MALERDEKLVRGELRPGGTEREWCDPDVLRRIRRATLAVLRREVEPADQAALGRFLPAWHGVGRRQTLREALVPLQGLALPVSLWESDVLPRRVPSYRPADLDALCGSGDVVWVGAGLDRVAMYFREDAALLGSPAAEAPPEGSAHSSIRTALGEGALFWADLLARTELEPADALAALWDLVWARRSDERFVDAASRIAPLRRASSRAEQAAFHCARAPARRHRRRAGGRSRDPSSRRRPTAGRWRSCCSSGRES